MIHTKLYSCGDTPANFESACLALADAWHALQVANFRVPLHAYCRHPVRGLPGDIYVAERPLRSGDKRMGDRPMSVDWGKRDAAGYLQAWGAHEPLLADRLVVE